MPVPSSRVSDVFLLLSNTKFKFRRMCKRQKRWELNKNIFSEAMKSPSCQRSPIQWNSLDRVKRKQSNFIFGIWWEKKEWWETNQCKLLVLELGLWQTSGIGWGSRCRIGKNLNCWGRIAMILTLIKYNGMISEKLFVPGKSLSAHSVWKRQEQVGLKMLTGTEAQFPDHLNEGVACSCISPEALKSKKPGGWGDFCDLKWNIS